MLNYLEQLNPAQHGAVTNTDGAVLVVAGPGSGKTRVLTYRIAYLIEQGVAPWEILALTFTNKSAKEMKERIEKVVGSRAHQVWAGTFHSIFARILRVEAVKIGYPSNFTIYDSDDSKSVLNAIIKEMNLDKATYNANSLLSRISSAKSNVISPAAYAVDENLMSQDRIAKRPLLYKIYAEYANRCRRSGAMDFDDLLYQMFYLLYKNPDNVCEKYRAKFRYLLVDEFQDTNYLQYSIIKKLTLYAQSPQNLCVVGDDAQSIYAFRGATIDNILDFQKDFKDMKTFKLEQNYRSTHHIVQAANDIISRNKKQIKKEIWTDKAGGQRVKLFKTVTDNEEGKRVADLIVEQKNRNHLRNSEVVILYRTNSQSRVFEEHLRHYNLPYKVFGGMSFYQRKEVKDLLAYLRLTVNRNDEEAFRRSVNYPKRGIGDSTVEKISEIAAREGLPMWDCASSAEATPRAKKSLNDFLLMINQFAERAKKASAYELAVYIAKQSGLLDSLKTDTTVEGLGRLENVNALLDSIKEFVENDLVTVDDETVLGIPTSDKSLATYLQNIALYTEADKQTEENDYVSLMSVHAAKGLEFKSVFVVGLEESLFPSFMAMDSAESLDEERRLFYVAVTRAEQFLTLSYAASRYKFGQMRYNEPSRFLEEIGEAHLDNTAESKLKSTSVQGNSAYFGNGAAKQETAQRSGVLGKISTLPKLKSAAQMNIDLQNFRASPSAEIQKDMTVLHLKFGEGKVLNTDGANDNRVATILFEGIDEPEKRIMLKFAKLQILTKQ